jgi:hypothetical protein
MHSGQPYCPFKCDVWQLGWLFFGTFNVRAFWTPLNYETLHHKQQITLLPSEIKDLYLEMTDQDPERRPTAVVALERLRLARDKTPPEVLRSLSPEEPLPATPGSSL